MSGVTDPPGSKAQPAIPDPLVPTDGAQAPNPAQAPTGTVTFLFTDIEGSTRRWEHYPRAMEIDIAAHDSLLREAIEANGGYVFKTIGDAFWAAFPTALQAVAAALAAQRALYNHEWGQDVTSWEALHGQSDGAGPLRVRMALH